MTNNSEKISLKILGGVLFATLSFDLFQDAPYRLNSFLEVINLLEGLTGMITTVAFAWRIDCWKRIFADLYILAPLTFYSVLIAISVSLEWFFSPIETAWYYLIAPIILISIIGIWIIHFQEKKT